MSNVPRNLDWVTARSNCSLSIVFEQLRTTVQEDIALRNAMREPYPQEYGGGFKYKFDFIGASKKFTALVHGHSLHKTVSFSLADNWIEIQPDNSPMFKATVGLNDEGECVLDVDGEQRYPWQVRKMALEDLFFGVE